MAVPISFSKYHGLGNSIVIVDNRQGIYDLNEPELARGICCPKTGVGADCVLEVINCRHGNHMSCAFEFITHTPSGLKGFFCGSGSRCLAGFTHKLGIIPAEGDFNFCGPDGEHTGRHLENGLVEIGLRDVNGIIVYNKQSYYVFTGCPVHVEFVKAVKDFDLQTFGDKLAFHSGLYHKGVAIMIVEENQGQITTRSYEHALGGETWSCGTGTTGVALVTDFRNNEFTEPGRELIMEINMRLGKLYIKATHAGENAYKNISMIGPYCHVFDGTYLRG